MAASSGLHSVTLSPDDQATINACLLHFRAMVKRMCVATVALDF